MGGTGKPSDAMDGRHRPVSNRHMARALIDLSTVDLSGEALTTETMRRHLPQRYEFEMVGGVCHLDREKKMIVAHRDFRLDDWWVKGHFPGRPIVPGVLMLETAAQVATLLWKETSGESSTTVGLGGVEGARFRQQVVPPARLHVVATSGIRRSFLIRMPTQGFVDGKLAFEATIIGVVL
jgi:3-hydroxyacyl-[acyl-carrier-protein] dehydratase